MKRDTYVLTDEDKAALTRGEQLTKAAAARMLGVTRQTIYAYLNAGRLKETQDGKINTREAYRAFIAPKDKERRQSPAGQYRVSAT